MRIPFVSGFVIDIVNHIVADSACIKPVQISSGADVADHPVPVSPTSTDGWGELENGVHEGHDSDKDGWDDIDPQEEPKPSSLANIQAAQRRPVSQPKPQGRVPGKFECKQMFLSNNICL